MELKIRKDNDPVKFKGQIIRETEKAIKVAVTFTDPQLGWAEWGVEREIWLPKSKTEIVADDVFQVPTWLYGAKLEDLGAQVFGHFEEVA